MQNSENFRHINFWSNFDPGKTHKGKTSERGRFLLFRSFREFCYSIFIFRNLNDKLISTIVPNLYTGKEPTPQNSFQNFLQSNTGLLLNLCVSKMLYGHLEIRANSSSNFLGVLMVLRPPRKPCHFLEITHNTPRFLCNKEVVRTV
jgi:hypothetical protein